MRSFVTADTSLGRSLRKAIALASASMKVLKSRMRPGLESQASDDTAIRFGAATLKPSISILIPTRERYSTLGAAIRTALDQDYSALEVIVSDNASADATSETVSAFKDPRLTYVRAPKRLSMCDNFELALSRASGDYVIYIGDDDGLMPGACARLASIFNTHPSEAYYWPVHDYRWPSLEEPPAIMRCRTAGHPRTIDLVQRARRVVGQGGWGWTSLPKPYHNAISRELLGRLARKTGRVFHSTQHDVFLSFALPAFTRTAVDAGESLVINGSSDASLGRNAMAAVVNNDTSPDVATFVQECGEYQIDQHLWPGLPLALRMIADAITLAISMFPEIYQGLKFNHDAFLAAWTVRRPWRDIPRFASSIIARRAEIRQIQEFSSLSYLAYAGKFKAKMGLDRLAGRTPAVSRQGPCDVWECAQLLATGVKPRSQEGPQRD